LKIIQPISLPEPAGPRVAWPKTPALVVADNTDDRENIVITVYEPDPAEWEADFKRRKAS
jgi:hypothetical protein